MFGGRGGWGGGRRIGGVGAHPVNMPLRQEECESGVWQPRRCSRLWSSAPSPATQSDSAVMKSETHGGLYVIISSSLKLDRK